MALDEADVDPSGRYRRQELVPGFWPSASYALDIPHGGRHQGNETSSAPNVGVALSRLGPAAAFLGGVLGCLAALSLSASGFAPAIASALATVLLCGPLLLMPAAQRFPGEFYSAIYGGSFAGMTPVLWLCSGASAGAGLPVCVSFVSLALVCGLAFAFVAWLELHLGHPLARGFGGRSGAIATAASFLFVALAPLFGGDDSLFGTDRTAALDVDPELTFTYIACTAGMFVTLTMLRLPRLMAATTGDRTLAAAALALAGLLILHLSGAKEVSALNAFYAGCFLGTSTPERLRGVLQPVLGAIILTALLIEERALLYGIGGSLGLAAFVAMLLLTALHRIPAAVAGTIPPRTRSAASGGLAPPITRTTGLWPEPRLPVAARSPVKIPVRRSRMIFAPMAGALAMVGLLLPIELSPDEPALSVVASESARKPEPAPEHPALMLAAASAVDATRALASLHTGSIGPSTVAGHPAIGDVKAYAEEPATTELDTGSVPVVARQERTEKLFREFLQWSASHEAAGAQPGVQPAAPRRDINRTARPAAAALTGAPHPVRPVSDRRPVRAVAAVPAVRRVAPKPLPGPQGNPDQPAGMPFSTSRTQ